MSTILMVANAGTYRSALSDPPPGVAIQRMSMHDFYRTENLVRSHDDALWKQFHTHGSYAHLTQKTDYIFVARDELGRYIGSAMIIELDKERWSAEYVITAPGEENRGVASAVLGQIMCDAHERGVKWIMLKCEDNEKLPRLYSNFGFVKVEV